MDINVTDSNKNIRKIEDIIDIQKANGNFKVRQVAFNLPFETESALSANIAKSLESGLTKVKTEKSENKKIKKLRSKRHKSPIPEVISWPSDSDITVLRMKLCLTNSDIKEKKVGNMIPGDGLHQPDSSSMVNLATLMRRSQPPSKHSMMEEYLLPLSSWERGAEYKPSIIEEKVSDNRLIEPNHKLEGYNPTCSRLDNTQKLCSSIRNEEIYSEASTKSKLAKFLRLYFCPCCRCLYKMENMSDDPSTYKQKFKEQVL